MYSQTGSQFSILTSKTSIKQTQVKPQKGKLPQKGHFLSPVTQNKSISTHLFKSQWLLVQNISKIYPILISNPMLYPDNTQTHSILQEQQAIQQAISDFFNFCDAIYLNSKYFALISTV